MMVMIMSRRAYSFGMIACKNLAIGRGSKGADGEVGPHNAG